MYHYISKELDQELSLMYLATTFIGNSNGNMDRLCLIARGQGIPPPPVVIRVEALPQHEKGHAERNVSFARKIKRDL